MLPAGESTLGAGSGKGGRDGLCRGFYDETLTELRPEIPSDRTRRSSTLQARPFKGVGCSEDNGPSLARAGSSPNQRCTTAAQPQTRRPAIMRSMMGCRMISIAIPILPPGTTMLLRRDMKESWTIDNR